jgi:hypothetical protein
MFYIVTIYRLFGRRLGLYTSQNTTRRQIQKSTIGSGGWEPREPTKADSIEIRSSLSESSEHQNLNVFKLA